MKLVFSVILPVIATCLYSCTYAPHYSERCRDAISELDRTIERKDEIQLMLDGRISKLYSQLNESNTPEAQYRIYKDLFDAFSLVNLDSSLRYAHIKEAVAQKSSDPALICDAKFDLAQRYFRSGMFHNALENVMEIDTVQAASSGQMANYYQTLHSIYHYLTLTTKDPVLRQNYKATENKYRGLSNSALKEGMLDYYTVKAGIALEEGQTAIARQELEKAMENKNLAGNSISILHYWMAKVCAAEGDTDGELMHYATSAKYDLLTPVRASRSLANTARILFKEKGDIKRAHSYINLAYEGALEADSHTCIDEISQILPDINASFVLSEQRKTISFMVVIAILALLLGLTVLIMFLLQSFQKKIRTANKALESRIAELKEANKIKDLYLGRYLSLFSSHINRLERYNSELRITAKSRNLDNIIKLLRSNDFIDAEREKLFKDFDSTFLGVFPNFVSDLNKLLKEGNEIGSNLPEGKLSSELRVFALIRLGVTESAKIAQFLRKSPSTIYNYRVKLRNAAACPYDEFERRVMEIGNDN